MEQSYLQRAKHWVETAEDVDIESLESTLARFTSEQRKYSLNPMQNASKIKDMAETIEYLTSELKMLSGVDFPIPATDFIKESCSDGPGYINYAYDPSPLVDISESTAIVLSKEERRHTLSQIKNMPGIISVDALIKK